MALKKYTKKDFLSFAIGFDYSDYFHKDMKGWNLEKFQEFYGLSHIDDENGYDESRKKQMKVND